MKTVNPLGLNPKTHWSVRSTTDAGQYLTICKSYEDARACCFDLNRHARIREALRVSAPVITNNLILPPPAECSFVETWEK